MRENDEVTPVLFRVPRRKADGTDVIAVFPCDPAGYSDDGAMTCFAHFGQHGACSREWYNTTRAATATEYADIKAELEAAPYRYRLQVYKRLSKGMHERRRISVRRMSMAPGAAEESPASN